MKKIIQKLTALFLLPTLSLIGSNTFELEEYDALDYIISPEIRGDAFYAAIFKIASTEPLDNILEIGSSSGEGSTDAFVKGIRINPHKPNLYCMELSVVRFDRLKSNYANDHFVKCYNISSVSLDMFPSEEEVISFYQSERSTLNLYPLNTVLDWLRVDIAYVKSHNVDICGIEHIKQENKIDLFDMVLIDGSEFTGKAELDLVYGAKYILLDDINSFKNKDNHNRLRADPKYELLIENRTVRNGFSVFRLRG